MRPIQDKKCFLFPEVKFAIIQLALLFTVGLTVSYEAFASEKETWKLDFISKGIKSDYTNGIRETAQNWVNGSGDFCKLGSKKNESPGFQLTPHLVDEDDIIIGFSGFMKINAPIENVIKSISDPGHADIVHYQYNEVESKAAEAKLIELRRVKFISFLKISAEHTVIYQIFKKGELAVVNWQLKEKSSVLHSDGVFLLSSNGSQTEFCQLSVYRAKFGPAALFPEKIWKESYLGALQEGLSIKIRSEYPTMSKDQHVEKVRKLLPTEVDYDKDIDSRNKPLPFKIKRG